MKHLKIFTVLMIAIFMSQCQNESIEETQSTDSIIPKEIIKGINNLGYNTVDFPVTRDKDYDAYAVEGDIVLPTQSILDAASVSPSFSKQRWINRTLFCNNFKDVKVKIGLRGINTPIRNAINDWNRVNGSFLKFRIVNNNEDVIILFTKGEAGLALPPFAGRPGNVIRIDPQLYNNVPNRGRAIRATIRHELGHIAGLRHTNTNDGARIPGTPNRDRNSVMNAAPNGTPIANLPTGNLTNADKNAIRKLFGGRNPLCN